jgi:rhamnulokinase
MTVPVDTRALIAVDLGAQSCRISLLQWQSGQPVITLAYRFANAPYRKNGELRWDLSSMSRNLDEGLRKCAELAPEGVRSIAVDGWAVDYVRINQKGEALADPYCYRDERTQRSQDVVHSKCSAEQMRRITGIQIVPLNTIYQLEADKPEVRDAKWLNLPEYFLARWGGEAVSERTNATHTQLVDLKTQQWSAEIFAATGMDIALATKIVPPGTDLGVLRGELAELPAFRETRLIAPACHDTASAIAGIPADGENWAYISSGTWSLVGTLLNAPQNNAATAKENFTNLGAVGGKTCFHKSVNGLWLLHQCMESWAVEDARWTVPELVSEAAKTACPDGLIDVDEPDLLLPDQMPERMNRQRIERGLKPLDTSAANAPIFASLIFHSLAERYGKVLKLTQELSEKQISRIYIVGGGSLNKFLNSLTAAASGLEVIPAAAESSTAGNFAVQLAALEGSVNSIIGADYDTVMRWARILQTPKL